MRRLLIVNADDFGLTEGVSRAIVRAHEEGVVTSTSLLAVGPAFARTAAWLEDVPQLGLGAHLAVVGEDPPLLSAREIPTLVDRNGGLAPSWRAFLPRVATGRVDIADVEREFEAQLAAISDAVGSSRLTHLDTHQHLHLWPPVGRVLLRVAARWGIRAARLTRSSSRSPVGRAVNRLARRFEHGALAAGVSLPAAFAGFDEGGRMDEACLVSTIARLAASGAPTAEIGVHPGEEGDRELARYQWGYRWGTELAALTGSRARGSVESHGFVLGTFGDLEASKP